MRNCCLRSNVVFEKVVISHSNKTILQACSISLCILKAHKLVQQGYFIIFFQLQWPIESNFSKVCYFTHTCTLGYNKFRKLVFVNYTRYPVPLKGQVQFITNLSFLYQECSVRSWICDIQLKRHWTWPFDWCQTFSLEG